jgi:hypothetical protein
MLQWCRLGLGWFWTEYGGQESEGVYRLVKMLLIRREDSQDVARPSTWIYFRYLHLEHSTLMLLGQVHILYIQRHLPTMDVAQQTFELNNNVQVSLFYGLEGSAVNISAGKVLLG